MKKIYSALIAIPFILVSCSSSTPRPHALNIKNIRTQHFLINPQFDTLLTGLRGGIFVIPRNSFEGGGAVEIEIKEVYGPAEMLYAGLATESNDRLLESGGMVYINAKRKGKQLRLLKPVDISIPANYINKEMQVFTGEMGRDSTINWVDPQPLINIANNAPLDSGATLFNTLCASCHDLFRDKTGPALAGVEERVNNRKVIRSFLNDPAGAIAENAYFNCLKAKFGSMQPAFPALTNHDIDLLLDYVRNETDKRPDRQYAPAPQMKSVKADTINSNCRPAPCGFDTIYVDTTGMQLAAANLNPLPEEATRADSMDALYKKPEELERIYRTQGFSTYTRTNGRYDFTVKTLGWYNVDAFYEGLEGTALIDLFASTGFAGNESLEVYVFFPEKKILTIGTYHTADSLFHFEKYKGQIPLFMNDNAIAFALGSTGEKMYYGLTPFKVMKNQTIRIDIKETSPGELTSAFRKMELDHVALDMITKKRILIPADCDARHPARK